MSVEEVLKGEPTIAERQLRKPTIAEKLIAEKTKRAADSKGKRQLGNGSFEELLIREYDKGGI